MGGDGELSPEGNEALQYLVRKGQSPVPVSLIRNTLLKRKAFRHEEKLNYAFEELVSAGYVQKINPPRNETGRPPKPVFILHPRLLAKDDVSPS